ncbi:hypothetical protein ACFL3V_04275 [Nanoarchaeota archaeon]
MGLLNIGKKKAAEKAEDVPDELPDLPGEQQAEVPDELPPMDSPEKADLAPDELPPVTGGEAELGETADDQRLYFSNMLQQLHEEGLKSTKLTSPKANLLADMKKHWRTQKRTDQLDAMNQELTESVQPLQRLEQEWVSLNSEIELRKNLLREKEDEIKRLAEELRTKALKVQRANKK